MMPENGAATIAAIGVYNLKIAYALLRSANGNQDRMVVISAGCTPPSATPRRRRARMSWPKVWVKPVAIAATLHSTIRIATHRFALHRSAM